MMFHVFPREFFLMVGPGGMAGGFRLLERLFPVPRLETVSSESLPALAEKYKRRDRLGNRVGCLAWIVLALAYFVLIEAWAAFCRRGLGDVRHVIEPFVVEYVCFAGLLAAVSSTFIVLVILRSILGRTEFERYMVYCGWRMPSHYHLGKAFRAFFVVFFFPLALVTLLRAATFTAFTPETIVDSRFGSFGAARKRAYSDVRGLYVVHRMHGRQRDLPEHYFLIVFTDGSSWETSHGSQGNKLAKEQEVARYVADRCGLPVVDVNFREDVPEARAEGAERG